MKARNTLARLAMAGIIVALMSATRPARADIVQLGATVFDSDGQLIGTIVHIDGDLATIDTGTTKMTLTLMSFALRSKGLILAMPRARLEALAAGVQARSDAEIIALLTPDAPVYGPDGQVVARAETATGQNVTLRVGDARMVLALSAFTKSQKGATIRLSAADLQALIDQQAARR